MDQIYSVMPLRITSAEENESQRNTHSQKGQVKSESKSFSSSADEENEQEEFETADEASSSSEEGQLSPQCSVPETAQQRQRPRRTRKPPDRLEYHSKRNPKGHSSK